jgi:hypothetical protein
MNVKNALIFPSTVTSSRILIARDDQVAIDNPLDLAEDESLVTYGQDEQC